MSELQDPQHEQFVRLLAEGSGKVDAYLQVYPETDPQRATAQASRLAARPEIENRLGDLLEQSSDEAIWTLKERLEYCRAAAETPYAAIDDTSPLCKGIKYTAHGVQYKMPDKLAAVALYTKLAADEDAAQAPGRNLLGEMIGAIRSRKWSKEAQKAGLIPKPPAPTSLGNHRHERFAQLVGSGERPAYAYEKIYQVRRSTARIEGYRLSKQPEVAERIRQIRHVGAALAGWSPHQRMRYLRTLAETPVGQITEDSPYCQGVIRTRYGVEIQTPDKLKAVALYSQLAATRQEQKRGKTIEQVVTNMRSQGDHKVADGIERSLLAYVSDTIR